MRIYVDSDNVRADLYCVSEIEAGVDRWWPLPAGEEE